MVCELTHRAPRPALVPACSGPGVAELLSLLRLHEVALASPAPVVGLRAMVDEMYSTPGTSRVVVGVPEKQRGRIRYLAHAGRPNERAHRPGVTRATPMAAKALSTGEMVQLTQSEGSRSHACIHVPVLGAAGAMGFFAISLHAPVPVEPWREQVLWAASDLMALLLLNYRGPRPMRPTTGSPLHPLTPRQRDALLELVDGTATNADIGMRLGLSARTVKIHLMAVYRQLGVRRRAEATRLMLTDHADWLADRRRARDNGTIGD